MKTIVKGMVLLLAGTSFIACSKDFGFDEDDMKQAAAEQVVNKYEAAFVNHFGTIASDQDWGFSQARGIGSLTRGISVGEDKKKNAPVECEYKIPNDITNIKNGAVANAAQSDFNHGKGVDINGVQNPDVDFVNFWMQHFNTAQGSHSPLESVQVYETGKGWVEIPGFWKGNGNDVTYFQKNTKSKGTALLTGMGGKAGDPDVNSDGYGKLFRWKVQGADGYSYDYKFLDFVYNDYKFLVLGFNAGNGDWWEFVIRPAIGQNGLVEEGRIMCEDLGDTKDFDFNDVVFDAKRYDNGKIEITLLAAGGKLPIYVAGVDVHSHIAQMKNTGLGNDVKAYKFETSGYASIMDIPVKVVLETNNTQNALKYEYTLGAAVGKVPQKICAPIGTNWPKEYKDINDAYSNFKSWVQENNPKLWMTVEDTSLTYSIFVD